MRDKNDMPPELVQALRHVLVDAFQKYLGKSVEEHRDALTKDATQAVFDFLPAGHTIPREDIEEMIVLSIDNVFGPRGININ